MVLSGNEGMLGSTLRDDSSISVNSEQKVVVRVLDKGDV